METAKIGKKVPYHVIQNLRAVLLIENKGDSVTSMGLIT